MIDRKDFKMTGGVFFSILFPACDELETQKNYEPKNSHKGPHAVIMSELLYVITGERAKLNATERETFNTMTNRYRFCRNNQGAHLRIGKNDAIAKVFDNEIKNNYWALYQRMANFVEGYIQKSEAVKKSFIKAMLELMEIDKSSISVPLYTSGKVALAVDDVISNRDIDFAAFTLGIWHYCVTAVDNTLGKDTVDVICPSNGGKKRPYVGDLGCNISGDIVFVTIPKEIVEDAVEEKEAEPEIVEVEVVDTVNDGEERKEDREKSESPKPSSTMMFNFNVTGNNNSFYNHVDTVNNYYGGKKDGQ